MKKSHPKYRKFESLLEKIRMEKRARRRSAKALSARRRMKKAQRITALRSIAFPPEYNYSLLSDEFFRSLEQAAGLKFDHEWRKEFISLCADHHSAFTVSNACAPELVRTVKENVRSMKKNKIFERQLLRLYCLADGRLRGSWGSDGQQLDGPMFRFLRCVYPAIPECFRPRSAEALCRRCHVMARAVRATMKNERELISSPNIDV